MADEKKVNINELLSSFGISMDGAIAGKIVKSIKSTNSPRTLSITAQNADGTGEIKFMAGMKPLQEGLLTKNEGGETVVAAGFHTWVRDGVTFASSDASRVTIKELS